MAREIFSLSASSTTAPPPPGLEFLGAGLHANFKTALIHIKGGEVRDATSISTGRLGFIRDSGQARAEEIERISTFIASERVSKLLEKLSEAATRIQHDNREAAQAFGLPAMA